MPRPILKPPTEGGQTAMIEYIVIENETLIAEHEKAILEHEEAIKDLKKVNEVLKE